MYNLPGPISDEEKKSRVLKGLDGFRDALAASDFSDVAEVILSTDVKYRYEELPWEIGETLPDLNKVGSKVFSFRVEYK